MLVFSNKEDEIMLLVKYEEHPDFLIKVQVGFIYCRLVAKTWKQPQNNKTHKSDQKPLKKSKRISKAC